MSDPTPSPTIEIVVEPNGSTSVETVGFVGTACQAASSFLERVLGQTTAEQLKPEYHEAVPTRQRLTERR